MAHLSILKSLDTILLYFKQKSKRKFRRLELFLSTWAQVNFFLTKPRTILKRNPYILMHGGNIKQLNCVKQKAFFKPYLAWGVGGNNSKCIWAKKLKFSGFSNKHIPINSGWAFIPTAWVLRHTALMPYFPYTRINLNLDLISVIGFQNFKTLWKAHDKSKQIALFLERNFAQKGNCTFSVFLKLHIFRF